MKAENWINISLLIVMLSPNILHAKVFRVAGIPEAPLRFYDENKKISGIDVDIIDHIFKKLMISYKIILLESSPGLKKIYQEKSADMILSFSKTGDRERYLDFSEEPHLKMEWYYFVLESQKNKYQYNKGLADLKGARVGVTHGFAYTLDFWNAIDEGVMKPVYEHSNSMQIHKLLKNNVDLVLLNRFVAMHHAKLSKKSEKITRLPKPVKSSFYYNGFVRNSSYPGIEKVKKSYDAVLKEAKSSGLINKILGKYET